MRTKPQSTTEILEIIADRVKSTSDSFSVFTGRIDGQLWGQATVKCFAGPVSPGQRWTLAGSWQEDPKYGRQLVAQFAALAAPRNLDELGAFLQALPGWDYSSGWKIRDAFGEASCTVIEDTPYKLLELGIGEDQLAALQEAWERGKGMASTYATLNDWGVSRALSDRMVKHYHAGVLDTIRENPYGPIQEIAYYTWRIADAIALNHLDIARDDPRRIAAGIAEVVSRQCNAGGHTWVEYQDAIYDAAELLDTDDETVHGLFSAAQETGQLALHDDRLYPALLDGDEQYIGAQLAQRLTRRARITLEQAESRELPETLGDEQRAVVVMALTNTVSILTGGPGVGKSHTLKALVGAAQSLGMPVTLMAPTGKAARRMVEATGGYEATTIHKRLKLIPGDHRVGLGAELVNGLVVVDEFSMGDTALTAALFSGISLDAQILLVGDPDQLPSVGPGAVLRDLLAADICTRVHLTKVFRNDAGIAVNAARMRAGESLVNLPDCQIRESATPEDAQQQILSLLAHELPTMGYSGNDVLVLTPTNDGESGRHALNNVLQALYNDSMAGLGMTYTSEQRKSEIRPGDKIIVTRNDSDLGVANGETGICRDVSPKEIRITLDDRDVVLRGDQRYLIQLAYAITIHKAQGSEAPVVVIPVFTSRILSRELIYTACTRARKLTIFVGDTQALDSAIRLVVGNRRRTTLRDRIVDAVHAAVPEEPVTHPFAHAADSSVYHTRKRALPWMTNCGIDSRAGGWQALPSAEMRPCMRCLASSCESVVSFSGTVVEEIPA